MGAPGLLGWRNAPSSVAGLRLGVHLFFLLIAAFRLSSQEADVAPSLSCPSGLLSCLLVDFTRNKSSFVSRTLFRTSALYQAVLGYQLVGTPGSPGCGSGLAAGLPVWQTWEGCVGPTPLLGFSGAVIALWCVKCLYS